MALLLVVLLIASLVQGFLGFGFGILAMTALAGTHELLHAAGVVNLTGIVSAGVLAFTLRRHIHWRLVASLLPTAAVGVLLGVRALDAWHGSGMTSVLGLAVVATAAFHLRARPRERPLRAAWGAPAGAVAGALAGAFNMGGPPVIAYIYSQPYTPASMRATTQIVFVSMSLLRVPTAAAHDLLTPAIVRDAAVGIPALLVGLFIGNALAQRVPARRFRRVCWMVFGLLGAVLAVRG